ncbi:hypothetical protein OSTOST_04590, partial [Ostertagia ostertagi]
MATTKWSKFASVTLAWELVHAVDGFHHAISETRRPKQKKCRAGHDSGFLATLNYMTSQSVKCPAGETFFDVHGQLQFVTEPRLQNDVSQGKHRRSEEKGIVSFTRDIGNSIIGKMATIWT